MLHKTNVLTVTDTRHGRNTIGTIIHFSIAKNRHTKKFSRVYGGGNLCPVVPPHLRFVSAVHNVRWRSGFDGLRVCVRTRTATP